jgi:CO/xanthine dehydrogenase Mo-binding subunit
MKFQPDIGTPIPRVDAKEKISGAAAYINDIDMPGMLYAKTLRSKMAHGKIIKRHYPTLPEGYAIIDYRHIPGTNIVKAIYEDWQIFPVDEVRYIGEPILLVVGENKDVIIDILEAIEITYEEMEPQFEWIDSVIHYHYEKKHGSRPFADANRIIEHTYETGYQEQAYIEPQGMIGYLDQDKMTLIGSIQCPYYVKNAVLMALGWENERVRVIQAHVGGAFGGKEEYPSLIACQLAMAVIQVNNPVKLIFEREEDIIASTKRHPAQIAMKAAIDSEGHIMALKVHVGIDAGAVIGLSGVVLSRAMIAATGAYTIENLDVTGDVYRTHSVPTGAFRGFGAPQMMFAIEMFMEHIARNLGKEPLAYRMAYVAKQYDLTATSGTFRDPILMQKMIEEAMKRSRYEEKALQYQNLHRYQGIGMSFFLHGCGFTGSGEATTIKAKVRLRREASGVVHILIAAVDMGQGVRTAMRKLVAHMLEVPIDQVIYDLPDTDCVPDSGPTVASRTMMIVGGLVARAAQRLGMEPQIAVEIEETYHQPSEIQWDEARMQGDAYPAYSWGVNVVEVAVDPVTGEVSVVGAWSVYDVGKAIDTLMVRGQADGGLAQGIAYGYLEVMRHHQGKIQQRNLTDYIIPTAADMPPMETYLFDNPYAYGPYGAKGVGELTLVGGAPAIAKAIEMAIKRQITKIPVTPEMIMELMTHGED